VKDRVVTSGIAIVSVVVVAAVGVVMLSRPLAGTRVDVAALPFVNALLNSASAVLLVLGYAFIRRRRVTAHLSCMLGALVMSTLFLVSYVVYHAHAGSRPYGGHGVTRGIYLVLLVSHIVLAAVILPLALTTLARAWRGDYARHARLARRTLPLWLYVSVTGVVIYVMLYHLAPR
jgi:putative membrane protein